MVAAVAVAVAVAVAAAAEGGQQQGEEEEEMVAVAAVVVQTKEGETIFSCNLMKDGAAAEGDACVIDACKRIHVNVKQEAGGAASVFRFSVFSRQQQNCRLQSAVPGVECRMRMVMV